jgi:glutamine amidotransferase PdxT
MTFIRAPAITAISSSEVKVLSEFNGQPTSVRWRNITAFTWHPELGPTISMRLPDIPC